LEIRRPIVSYILKAIFNCLCKIDCKEFIETLKNNKPMIIACNHINFLEIPVVVSECYPLKITGLAKVETWNNAFFAFIFSTYKAVPINRRGAFSESIKKMKDMIEKGFFMCISPEGTRSKNGLLGKARAGIVQIALETDMPILPLAHHGGENIWKNLKRFRRTPFVVKTGNPFRIKFDGRPDKEEREKILAEVMGQVAKLLPEHMRGYYSEQANLESKYLDFM